MRKTEGGTLMLLVRCRFTPMRGGQELSMVRDIRSFGLVVVVALLTPTSTPAQAPPKSNPPIAPKSQQLDPDACGDNNRATVGQGGEVQTKKPDGRDLSDQLAQSNGVICPPPLVDPGIKAPTPQEGSMPVIPPPGSPGGNPNVQPK